MQLSRSILLTSLALLTTVGCDPVDACLGNCQALTDESGDTDPDDSVSGPWPTSDGPQTTASSTASEDTTGAPDPIGECVFLDPEPASHCNDGISQPGDLCFTASFGTSIPDGTNSSVALVLDADATADVVLAHDDGALSTVMNGPLELNPAFVPWPQTFDPSGALAIVGGGDLDGDGVGDVVVQVQDPENTRVHALFLDGQGGVASTALLGSFAQALNSLDLVDWDGDGHLDVVAVDTLVIVTVLRGDGVGGFVPSSGASVTQAFVNHALGALDADAAADDFVFVTGPGSLRVARHGELTPLIEFEIAVPGLVVHSLAIADLDQDGRGDIVAVGSDIDGPAGELVVALQSTGFAVTRYPVRCGPNVFAVGDLDGDGWPDLAAVSDQGEVTVRHNDGAGGFERGVTALMSSGAQRLHIADFDGDGANDIVAVGEDGMSYLTNGV